jgi:hypothetical protein
MEFEEVQFSSLKPQKYLMKWEDYEYIGTFHQLTILPDGIYADFENVYLKDTYLPVLYLRVVPDIQCKFYQPILGKAQENMEHRAINTILQQLIPYYEWGVASHVLENIGDTWRI